MHSLFQEEKEMERRIWLIGFLFGSASSFVLLGLSFEGGLFSSPSGLQRFANHFAEVVVDMLAFAGVAFALLDAVLWSRAHGMGAARKRIRAIARLLLALVLSIFAYTIVSNSTGTGTVLLFILFFLLCAGSTLEMFGAKAGKNAVES
jgi:hypothetical protein